jgi:hypothetical protein
VVLVGSEVDAIDHNMKKKRRRRRRRGREVGKERESNKSGMRKARFLRRRYKNVCQRVKKRASPDHGGESER